MKKKVLFPKSSKEEEPPVQFGEEPSSPTAEQEAFRLWMDTPEWTHVDRFIRGRITEALQGLVGRSTPERMLFFWQGYIHALEELSIYIHNQAGVEYSQRTFTVVKK